MMTLKLTKIVVVAVVATQVLGSSAFASPKAKETLLTANKVAIQDPYYQLKAAKIRELTDEEALEFTNSSESIVVKNLNNTNIPPKPPEAKEIPKAVPGKEETTPKPSGFFDGVIMVVDKLIAIGQKIIPTIDKGRAVVTNNPMAAVSVLPRLDTKDPSVHDMGNWSIPVTKHYKIAYTNGFGVEVISFVYSITFQHGGEYEGKGKYLTGIRASARNISVDWGFDLDASSQLIQISNIGSSANVIAGATIEMSYTVKNWTRQITTNEAFFISGDGKLYKLD